MDFSRFLLRLLPIVAAALALAGCGGSGGAALAVPPRAPSYIDASAQAPTVAAAIVLAADFRGNGTGDIFLAGDGQPHLFLNQGGGTFQDATGELPVLDLTTFAAIVVAIDGDGHPDLVLANGPRPRTMTFTATIPGSNTQDLEIDSNQTAPQNGSFTIMHRLPAPATSDALIAFPDVGAIPPYAKVTSATLEIFQYFPMNPTSVAITFEVFQNTRMFTASGPGTTTWTAWWDPSLPSPNEPSSLGRMTISDNLKELYRTIDITPLARRWVSDAVARARGATIRRTAGPFDLFFASDDPAQNLVLFPPNPPRLTIHYLDATNTILLNRLHEGQGFIDQSFLLPTPTALVCSRAVATTDFDLDGMPDLAFANDGTPPQILLNRPGVFLDISSALPPRTASDHAIAIVNVNGGPSPDIFIASAHDPPALFVNQGGSHAFVDEAGTRLPALFAPEAAFAVAGDLTGHRTQDIFIGTAAGGFGKLLLANGRGGFADKSALLSGSATGASGAIITDVNGDGIPDLVISDQSGMPVVLMGLGGGRFADISSALPHAAAGASSAAAANFAGTGKTDLFLSGPGGTRALLLER